MTTLNLYLCGVGGQGIGLLAEALGRACRAAGHGVLGCDTHGLAQRGGVVVSHLRLGEQVFTPLVPPGEADLVLALERLEALRAAGTMLRRGGLLLYTDVTYQPMSVRSGERGYPEAAEVEGVAAALGARVERLDAAGLPDPRMHNVALLGRLAASGAIPGVGPAELEAVLGELLPPAAREANLAVFRERAATP